MIANAASSPPPWHEIMDCVLSLAVGAALADSVDPERRNLMKPVRGEALIEGQLAHGEVVAIREFFGVLCSDAAYITTVDEGIAAYTKRNRHPTNVCKYLALACTEQQKLALITLLIRLAQADGEFGPREAWYIERAGFVMEIDDVAMPDIAGTGTPPSPIAHVGADLASHCTALGVKPPATVADIKAAYRAAAMRNHPDTLAASGAVSWEEANRRFRDVRRSYEALLTAAEAGLLGAPAVRRSKKDLESLQEAARVFWSGFPTARWTKPSRTIDELREEAERQRAQAKQSTCWRCGHRNEDPARASCERCFSFLVNRPGAPAEPSASPEAHGEQDAVGSGEGWGAAILGGLVATAISMIAALGVGVCLGAWAYRVSETLGGLIAALSWLLGPVVGLYVIYQLRTGVWRLHPNSIPAVKEGADALWNWYLVGGFISLALLVAIGLISDSLARAYQDPFLYLVPALAGLFGAVRRAYVVRFGGLTTPTTQFVCGSCSAELVPNAPFCPKCGSGLACRACLSPLPADARFCGKCGTPIAQGAAG